MRDFSTIVQQAWAEEISGTPMFRVVKKLRRVKEKIIEWKETQLPISTKLQETRTLLDTLQQKLVEEPQNSRQKRVPPGVDTSFDPL